MCNNVNCSSREDAKDELLKEIDRILSDVKNFRNKGVGELFNGIDKLENDLEIFANNLKDFELVEVEE
ncbi:hypothetical protein [Anaerococcus marasmi]|uniref:hypothetical protein n=1 Tax=Anaerococcus marasmi TaxID=2057797 RepID=UPI000CFA3842|nr:hypothetical protein [Anaerococcus marasmi]